ncbi:MAG TPA: hypothetical protein VIK64_18585 [Anaerolineales bacterium]
MKIIRAAEIGAYVYCQRAWWYRQQGYESTNLDELAMGSELHYQHGRRVLVSGCIRILAYGMLLLALLLLAVYFTGQLI